MAAADGHGFAGGTFVAQVDSELGEYRIDDGSLVRLIDENEATFVGEIEVASDGVVHLSVGFEDGWYSCEFVAGSVWRYPADATAPTQPVDLGPGGGVALAPDEGRLAYAAPSECVPDPVEEQFVIAPLDTVVVADLDDGTEQRWTFPAGIDPDLERVRGVGWLSDDALLVMVDGTLLTLDVTSPDVPALDVAVAPVQSGESYLLGIRDGNAVVLTYPGGQRDRRLDLVDPSTGEVVAPLATGQITMAALDASGEHLAVIDDGNLFLDSTEVQVEGHTIDGNVFAVGW